eukprot:gene2602-3226_t
MSTESATNNTETTTTTPSNPNARLFVGNLSFKVDEVKLNEIFAPHGKVLNTRVVKGHRGVSSGFGFVEMENEEAAQKVITALHQKEFDGRAINVELAKERSTESRPPRRSFNNNNNNGSRRPRGRAPHKKGNTGAPSTAPATTTPSTDDATTAPVNGSKPPRGPRAPRGGPRQPRKPSTRTRPTRERGDRQPSPTTLYVNNVPFSLDDAKFLEIFKEFNPKSAHLVVNTKLNRSKGYGFVEFNNTEDQQKALSLDKTKIQEREITVKVALVEQTAAPAEATETPAATN